MKKKRTREMAMEGKKEGTKKLGEKRKGEERE